MRCNGAKRQETAGRGRKRCCGRQPKGTSGRGDPWPGLCSRGQPRGASKAPLPARLACYSARASDPRGGGRGSRWGSCRRPGAAAAAARGARQGAQEGAVALGQGQERAGMGRARVGVPPGERRLRAAHVERVGAAAVGARGGVIAGKGGWGSCARNACGPAEPLLRLTCGKFSTAHHVVLLCGKIPRTRAAAAAGGAAPLQLPHANSRQMDGTTEPARQHSRWARPRRRQPVASVRPVRQAPRGVGKLAKGPVP